MEIPLYSSLMVTIYVIYFGWLILLIHFVCASIDGCRVIVSSTCFPLHIWFACQCGPFSLSYYLISYNLCYPNEIILPYHDKFYTNNHHTDGFTLSICCIEHPPLCTIISLTRLNVPPQLLSWLSLCELTHGFLFILYYILTRQHDCFIL